MATVIDHTILRLKIQRSRSLGKGQSQNEVRLGMYPVHHHGDWLSVYTVTGYLSVIVGYGLFSVFLINTSNDLT